MSRLRRAEEAKLGTLANGHDLPHHSTFSNDAERVARVSQISFLDLASAQQLVASVEVKIPWYIIDPQGVNIIKQRRKLAAQRKVEAIRTRDGFQERVQAVFDSSSHGHDGVNDSASCTQEKKHIASFSSRLSGVTLFPFWDIVTALALIFTVTVTPFEVGFLEPPTRPDTLWITNRVVDGIFVLDVLFQFFIMVPKSSAMSSAFGQGDDGITRWETDVRVIGRLYLRGWFFIDVVSIAPFIFDILPLLSPDGDSTRAGKALRTLRALRLIKLLRLLRASRVTARMKERVSWSTASVMLISLTFQVCVLTHSLACLVAISTTFYPAKLDTWFGTFGYCEFIGLDDLGDKIESCVEPAELYRVSLTWGLGLLVDFQGEPKTGPMPPYFSDPNYPVRFTVYEEILLLVAKLVCLFAWTIIFGRLLAVLTHQDPDTMAYKVDLDSINRFCGINSLTTELTLDVRRYFFNTLAVRQADSRVRALSKLSPALQEKIVWHINAAWLHELPLFSMLRLRLVEGERKTFLCQLVLRMKAHLYAAKEVPPPKHLYFITSGTVLHRPMGGVQQTLGPGMTWGAADVLSFRRGLPSAVAVGFVQCQVISREELLALKLTHHRPFMLMYAWTMFREVGKHLVQELGTLPPAIKLSDVGKKLSLKGGFTDGARAVLSLDGAVVSGVRFPGDKIPAARRLLGGRRVTGVVNASALPVGVVYEVEVGADGVEIVGGAVKVIQLDGAGTSAELPNPRALPWDLMEDLEEEEEELDGGGGGWLSPMKAAPKNQQQRGLVWTKEEVEATSPDDLAKLKLAIEEKQARATRLLEDQLREARATIKANQRGAGLTA